MSGSVSRPLVGRSSPFLLVFLLLISSLVPLFSTVQEVEANSSGRHIYTFSDGTSSAIALASPGSPARNIMVSLPKGAEVLDAELTLSGASSTGWNQVASTNRADWMSGESNSVEPRSDDLSLGFNNPETSFVPYSIDSTLTSGDAWYDDASFSIRQPHSTNASESTV